MKQKFGERINFEMLISYFIKQNEFDDGVYCHLLRTIFKKNTVDYFGLKVDANDEPFWHRRRKMSREVDSTPPTI